LGVDTLSFFSRGNKQKSKKKNFMKAEIYKTCYICNKNVKNVNQKQENYILAIKV